MCGSNSTAMQNRASETPCFVVTSKLGKKSYFFFPAACFDAVAWDFLALLTAAFEFFCVDFF